MKHLIILILLLTSNWAFAHGSDKPGPHGGFVEMPGAFHTEVVPEKDGSFRVYLLDMNFQNPVVTNSSVEAWIEQGEKKSNLKCEVMGNDHFHCTPEKGSFKKAQLIVKAKRNQMQGNEAKYKLPLKHHK